MVLIHFLKRGYGDIIMKIKKIGLTIILAIIFLLGITYFIHENRESSTVPLPATGSEEIIVSDDPIDPDTHHTYTPQNEEP